MIKEVLGKPSFDIEKQLFTKGYRFIAGLDEAGRGSLAGPLAVSFTIYDQKCFFDPNFLLAKEIDDSKKITASKRKKILSQIEKKALTSLVIFISHNTIDQININRATELAVRRLLKKTKIYPDVLIMDGNFSFNLPIPFFSIIKGDNKSISIASSSIKAKVSRDELMEKLDNYFPIYNFKKHKGYGTQEHRDLILKNGFCKIHRKSYEPVKSLYLHQKQS